MKRLALLSCSLLAIALLFWARADGAQREVGALKASPPLIAASPNPSGLGDAVFKQRTVDDASETGRGSDTRRERIARVLVDLLNEWDEQRFTELGNPEESKAGWEAELAWRREYLGACQAPRLLHRGAKRSRFMSECENGSIEIAPMLDERGRFETLLWGIRDMDPNPEVRDAAEGALALRMRWDSMLAEHGLSANFNKEELQATLIEDFDRWGSCALGNVDLGSKTGAIFDLACDGGPRSMKLSLDGQRRISRLAFWPRRSRY